MLEEYYYGGILKTRYKKVNFLYNNKIIVSVRPRYDINVVNDMKLIILLKLNTKLKLNDILISLGAKLKKCAFCNDYSRYDINVNIVGLDIHVNIMYDMIKCKINKNGCYGSTLNPNSIEFISKAYNMTNDEALKHIKKRNKSPFYKENFKNVEDYKKSQTRDLEYFTNKYNEEGIIKYKKYKDKLKYSHSEKYYIDKFGTKNGKKHWLKLSKLKDSMSFSFHLKKYKNKEEAEIKYKERLFSVSTTLDGFINRDGYKIGIEKYNSLIDKRKELIKKLINNGTFTGGVSKSSISFFDNLNTLLIQEKIIINKDETMYGKKNEKVIYNERSGTCFFYDYFIKKHKIIIEFNGIKFHPKSEDDINFKHPYKKDINTKELYMNDQYKLQTAQKYGYSTIVVWEDDDNKLNNCIRDIKNILNKNNK